MLSSQRRRRYETESSSFNKASIATPRIIEIQIPIQAPVSNGLKKSVKSIAGIFALIRMPSDRAEMESEKLACASRSKLCAHADRAVSYLQKNV